MMAVNSGVLRLLESCSTGVRHAGAVKIVVKTFPLKV
jgi:hypothetical protein